MSKIVYPHLCWFPTTSVFIDDSEVYLNSLKQILSAATNNSCRAFLSASDGIDFIKKKISNNTWYEKYLTASNETYIISRQVLNKHRFDAISTIFIDYDMPELNGLDVAEKLSKCNVNKILLTGAANADTVIKAFNDNLIEGYIKKSDERINEKLINFIDKGKNLYFEKIEKYFLNANPSNFLDKKVKKIKLSKEYISLFNKILKFYSIVEFYEVENDICYLLLDAKGESYMFYFYSEYYLDDFYKFAQEEDLPQSILFDLKSKCKMFCFDKNIDINTLDSLKNYKNNIHTTSSKIIGGKKYFYSIVKKGIDNAIFPFKKHIKKFI